MVKEGTAHLENVVVVPSGTFVLSRRTMSAYFEKETLQESRIDASKDVAIFGSYIAPALSVSVRFIGEEPFDSVTRQYNREMKRRLPLYGINVIEISRADVEGVVISASAVRDLYREKRWEEIRKLVPDFTLRFLKTMPLMKDKKTTVAKESENESWNEVKRKSLFMKNNKVIFYPAGKESQKKYKRLSEEEKGKVFFADVKAIKGNYKVCGKDVMMPQMLLDEFKEFPIFITSEKYQLEIIRYFFQIGINYDRVYFF